MSKSKETNTKNSKKVAVKSLKEKRAFKAAKRNEKSGENRIISMPPSRE